MQVKTDSEGLIMAYALIGEIADGTDIIDELPENFVVDFQPGKFKLTNDGIMANDAYTEPVASQPVSEPTAEQKMIMQQATDISQMKQMIMSQASQIATLSKGSAE